MIIKSIDNKAQTQNQVSAEPHCVDLKRNMITKKVRSIQNQTEANLAQINLQEAAERLASPHRLSIMFDPNMEWSVSAIARVIVFLISGRSTSSKTNMLPLKKEQDLKELSVEELLALREKII